MVGAVVAGGLYSKWVVTPTSAAGVSKKPVTQITVPICLSKVLSEKCFKA